MPLVDVHALVPGRILAGRIARIGRIDGGRRAAIRRRSRIRGTASGSIGRRRAGLGQGRRGTREAHAHAHGQAQADQLPEPPGSTDRTAVTGAATPAHRCTDRRLALVLDMFGHRVAPTTAGCTCTSSITVIQQLLELMDTITHGFELLL
jgi:hypothetical protein